MALEKFVGEIIRGSNILYLKGCVKRCGKMKRKFVIFKAVESFLKNFISPHFYGFNPFVCHTFHIIRSSSDGGGIKERICAIEEENLRLHEILVAVCLSPSSHAYEYNKFSEIHGIMGPPRAAARPGRERP